MLSQHPYLSEFLRLLKPLNKAHLKARLKHVRRLHGSTAQMMQRRCAELEKHLASNKMFVT